MAVKGELNTTVDIPALNELAVAAKGYSMEVNDRIDLITTLCTQMQDEKSLEGGDGDNIRANFMEIAKGCQILADSLKKIDRVLNEKLAVALKSQKGLTTQQSDESAKKAAAGMGIVQE